MYTFVSWGGASRHCSTEVYFDSTTNIEIRIKMTTKEKIRSLLEDALPLVDFNSDFLFSELDSLDVTTILMTLSNEYAISLESEDATPRNLRSLDSLVALVENKLTEQK